MCLISQNIKMVAELYRIGRYTIDINHKSPYISINDKNKDTVFFMQVCFLTRLMT